MVTVIRIFHRNFAVYGRLRQDTVRKRAVYRRNPGHCNTAPYTAPYLRRIRSYLCRIPIKYGRKIPAWIRIKYGAVFDRLRPYTCRIFRPWLFPKYKQAVSHIYSNCLTSSLKSLDIMVSKK